MQPLTKHREVLSEGVTESIAFGISMKDQAHLKSILRDTLYSDKILAVLREYSANAWDAHRDAGKPDLPIEVTLPTWNNPTLIIKDYGLGLSHEDVFNVFAQYGASTKRDSNDAVGMLGIGSKSGFAYADTFTIVSRHGGKQRTYVALLDESENDNISLLSETDCGDDTGITIQIAVSPNDIYEFEDKARQLFQHFEPRPKINCSLPPIPTIQAKLKHGLLYDRNSDDYRRGEWFAVMGCIPYRINLNQLKGPLGEDLVSQALRNTSGLLRFEIGEVQINASREELKYSTMTKNVLVQKLNDLFDEFVMVTLEEIEKGGGTDWDKRNQAQVLRRLGLNEKEAGELILGEVRIEADEMPKSFSFAYHKGYGLVKAIPVTPETRLVRRTNIGRRSMKGFHLDSVDLLVVPNVIRDDKDESTGKLYSWDVVNADLEALIQKKQMVGISVVDLHTLPWMPQNGGVVRTPNAKHTARMFRMIDSKADRNKLSDNWEVVQRQPTTDDVFVIINWFKTEGEFNIYTERQMDERIAKHFNIDLPSIYGYKTTAARPVTADKVVGTHYLEWRKKFLASLPI